MVGSESGRRVQRIYLVAPEFGDIDGVAEQLVTLAVELAYRGKEIRVFLRRPCTSENQYIRRLKSAGIPVVQPPSRLTFLGRIDWAARDRYVQKLVELVSPLLILPAFFLTLFSDRKFRQNIDSGRGYLNRVLSKMLLLDYLDHVYHLQLAWHVWRRKPDIVEISRSDYVWQVDWFYRRSLPTIFKEHGTKVERSTKEIQNIRNATSLIAVSKAAADALRYSASEQQMIHIVPNAVDVSLTRSNIQPNHFDKEINNSYSVVCISRLSEEKGVQFLPEIVQTVLEKVTNVRFLVLGDGPLREELEENKKRCCLNHQLLLLGSMDHSNVLNIMRESDVVILPSLTEGLPLSIIEAMACGKAIVATAVGGTPELIRHEYNGFLVSPSDPQALANALIRLLKDPVLRTRLGCNARKVYIQGPWNPVSLADATLKIYERAKNELDLSQNGTNDKVGS
jgi:glycosyltransferase involved in cell wall biosynthesis